MVGAFYASRSQTDRKQYASTGLTVGFETEATHKSSSDLKKVKLQRAQGECLGTGSR